ncbi:hypothetical protein KLP40_02285 [Hymenobacter sp. NST-14]|uniref:LIC_10190 family membrane protein n=1 Tax=Hymenobacter piscis TaxID=2839984 RepID=UPI001C03079F|nr:hypothetical protein [Hymenobacter piscis]MBT9391980.1 hypothetical protein [Hymenobacter piscis]
MLLILGSWLLLALITTLIGWTAWRWLAARYRTSLELPVELLSLTGVALLMVVLAPVSLVAPIGPATQAATGTLVAALAVAQRRALVVAGRRWLLPPGRFRAAGWATAALLGLLLLNLLLRIQAGSANHDAQLYYLQTLQWLERYPAVPGLGNLHGRLAFNSHLFLVTALFRLPTPAGSFYPLPPYLLTLLAVAAARGVGRALTATVREPATWAAAGLGLFFPLLHLFQTWLASPAPDYALLVWLGLLLLFYSRFFGSCPVHGAPGRPVILLLILLSGGAVTVKLSALPVLLLPLHAFWVAGRHGRRRPWGSALVLASLIFIPWIGRNLVLSGYPVYPLPGLPGLPVDWKVPAHLVLTEQRLVTNMARLLPPADWYGPGSASWQQWMPVWWQYQLSQPVVAALLLLAAAAPLAVLWQRPRASDLAAPGWLSAWVVAAAGSLFWLLLAPDYRFGIGFLLVMAGWPWYSLPTGRRAALLLLALGVTGGLQLLRDPLYGLRHLPPNKGAAAVWPVLPPQPATFTKRLADGELVRIARAHGACGAAPVPCTFAVQPGLERRGKSLAAGFRIRAPRSQRR